MQSDSLKPKPGEELKELQALLLELVREMQKIKIELRKITVSREIGRLQAQLRGMRALEEQTRKKLEEEGET